MRSRLTRRAFTRLATGEGPQAQRAELLRARQLASNRWTASAGAATLTFLPYVAIDDEEYSTFLTLPA